MVTENGLESVTAKEVIKRYPGIDGRAAARNFLCEFCNNFVTLAQGTKREPFFKHSRGDIDKACPDRSDAIPGYQEFQKGMYLPRIRFICNGSKLFFEIGITGEFHEFSIENTQLIFIVNGCSSYSYRLFDRLLPDGITYLSVGSHFPQNLQIRIVDPPPKWVMQWHCQSPVMRKDGAIFDGKNHVFRNYDSNLFCEKEYIFLGKQRLPSYKNLEIRKTQQVSIGTENFYLQTFVIRPAEMTLEVTFVQTFQRKIGYRILNVPVAYTPVWPEFCWHYNKILVAGNQLCSVLYGNSTTLYRQQRGRNVIPWDYTSMSLNPQYLAGYIDCTEETLITMGRIHAFDYAYMQQSSLPNNDRIPPELVVETIEGMLLKEGIQEKLPPSKKIIVRSAYDFTVQCKRDGWLVYRNEVIEQHEYEFTVEFGDTIEIYQGLDLVFRVQYKKPNIKRKETTELCRLLFHQRDRHIPIDLEVKVAARFFMDDPLIKNWLRKQLQTGNISQKARIYLLYAARKNFNGGKTI